MPDRPPTPKEHSSSTSESENPVIASPTPVVKNPRSNKDWWPDQVDLGVLYENTHRSSPYAARELTYAEEVQTLDFDALKADVTALMTSSQEWWPADYGHYGGLFIRMSWHAAGTYRVADGRGGGGRGAQRFAPLNSWPDNASLDKARRLLWPIKQKYGRKLSWADLLVFAGNCAYESMGFPTFGFAFGREDIWEPEEIFWGPEDSWLGDERYGAEERELSGGLGAVQMGLIYVNPEGPNGQPDPAASARDIRETFGRMAMNDEETAALIVGGHTVGKTHGAGPADNVGPEPEGCPVHFQGIGWNSTFGTGVGKDAITSGLEVVWTPTPTTWDNTYLEMLYAYEWDLTESPAGAKQWTARGADAIIPDPFGGAPRKPTMLTSDLALRHDPVYEAITRRWLDHPEELDDAFGKAWYKLLHRDMGPAARFLGPWVPEPQPWQDPVPAVDHELVDDADVALLKTKILGSGLSVQQLVATAWAAATSFRGTDLRGGANGGRVRLEPQRSWEANEPEELAAVVSRLEQVQQEFNDSLPGNKRISFADLVVLAGSAAVEQAARDAGSAIVVPFAPGRTDATQEETDIDSFEWLKTNADGFRNYLKPGEKQPPERLLLEKAFRLTLTAPEMTVLVGGLRALNANHGGNQHGVLTARPGLLTNDFFTNLLDMSTVWNVSESTENVYEGRDRSTGEPKWTATAVDLVFGSNSILRSLAEVYAASDSTEKFLSDFVKAWTKVMEADRFDLHH